MINKYLILAMIKSGHKRFAVMLTAIIALSIIFSSAAFATLSGYSLDPTLIGVGARPLGMGKAYVAVAEDADTIFMNPAGLGRFNSIKLMSMYSSLMGDVNYYVAGGTMPLDIGSVGAALISSRVDNIWVLGANAVSATHSPTPTSFGNYSNNVFFLSYGFPLDRVIGSAKNVYLGANLKYFNQSAGGTSEADAGNGRGFDADLGLLYTPYNWLALGFNYQNALPASLGGTVTYKSGIEESAPAVAKIGTKIGLMGKQDEALFASPIKVNLAADTDIYAEQSGMPSATHFGAEIWPTGSLALRVGLDQDPTPSTVDEVQGKNLTYGVGMKIRGVEFDYAYHPFSQIGENGTHFFSISYVGEEEDEGAYLLQVKPRDKTITRRDNVNVSGMVSRSVDEVSISGTPVNIMEDAKGNRTFNLKLDFEKPGKNLIVVEAFDSNGNLLEKRKIRILKLATFSDVSNNFWAVEPIEFGATAGLVEGYPGGNFMPDRILSRAELATMLVRAKGEDLKNVIEKRIFPDLPVSHWASRYIDAANEMGLVVGYPDQSFRPNQNINRVEGVSVATRFDEDLERTPKYDPYEDVSKGHWGAGSVDAAKQTGLLDYISSDRFLPRQGLTRAEAVEILAKTEYGRAQIEDLLDWRRGYGLDSILRVSR